MAKNIFRSIEFDGAVEKAQLKKNGQVTFSLLLILRTLI